MKFYATGLEWENRHKHEARLYGHCARCGRRGLKRSMYTLFIRLAYRDGNPKTLTHLCEDCLPDVMDFLAVSLP